MSRRGFAGSAAAMAMLAEVGPSVRWPRWLKTVPAVVMRTAMPGAASACTSSSPPVPSTTPRPAVAVGGDVGSTINSASRRMSSARPPAARSWRTTVMLPPYACTVKPCSMSSSIVVAFLA